MSLIVLPVRTDDGEGHVASTRRWMCYGRARVWGCRRLVVRPFEALPSPPLTISGPRDFHTTWGCRWLGAAKRAVRSNGTRHVHQARRLLSECDLTKLQRGNNIVS